MKISGSLLMTLALGISTAAVQTSCHRDDIKSARHKQKKEQKKELKNGSSVDQCPACGRG